MNESLFTVSPNCFETSQIINKAQAKTKKIINEAAAYSDLLEESNE